jgi:hypothetical protein
VEGERLLQRYITHHLERSMKSAAFLRRLKGSPVTQVA